MKQGIIILILMICTGIVWAKDDRLVLSAASKHIGTDYQYNEHNYGIGYEHRLIRNTWLSVGGYTDSFYNSQSYAGVIQYFPVYKGNYLKVSLSQAYGLMTHTMIDNGERYFLFILPTVDLQTGRLHANLGFIPGNIAGCDVMTLQFKWDI